MRGLSSLLTSLLCVLYVSVVNPAFSAPTLTHLFPAGAQVGTTIEVTAAGMFDKWPAGVWVSGRGVSAKAAKDKGKLAVTVAADAAPGTYWVRLHDETGASGLRPFVVGTLAEVAEKEPNDEVEQAQAVEQPAVVNGRLQKGGDVDCFAVTLAKGQTLVAAVEANRTLKSPMDAVLQVVSSDGFVLAENHDHAGLDPLVAFAAPKAARYVVRVFAFPASPDSGIRFAGGENYIYRLTLTTGPFADFPLPLAVSRKGGEVALAGWNLDALPRRLPVPPSDAADAVVTHPELGNTVRVRVEPHDTFDAPGPAVLTPPASVTGRVERKTTATFGVQGKKGVKLTARVESRAFGLPLSPVVRVLDPAGKVVARGEPADPNADVAVPFTPAADGTYAIEVRDLHGGGGPRYAFLLRVEPELPDYTLALAADRFTVTPGKPTDLTVTVNRVGGFKDEIEVKAIGLPAGISTSVVPAGKGDAGKITLRLTAEKAGVSGAFRIAGTAKADPARTRVARAANPDGEPAADLWVTAPLSAAKRDSK